MDWNQRCRITLLTTIHPEEPMKLPSSALLAASLLAGSVSFAQDTQVMSEAKLAGALIHGSQLLERAAKRAGPKLEAGP